jgi:hypothetical protein
MTELQAVKSIEVFAHLCAILEDGFSDRTAALLEAGLDETGWSRVQEQWTSRMLSDAPLTQTFGAAYSAARLQLRRGGGPAAGAADLRFLSEAAQPWREEAAAVPTSAAAVAMPASGSTTAPLPVFLVSAADLDGTVVGPSRPVRPALPFTEPAMPFALSRAPLPGPAAGARSDALDVTADAPLHVPRPALPFAPAVPPGKRLARFDPMTGQPLAVPVLIDDPTFHGRNP